MPAAIAAPKGLEWRAISAEERRRAIVSGPAWRKYPRPIPKPLCGLPRTPRAVASPVAGLPRTPRAGVDVECAAAIVFQAAHLFLGLQECEDGTVVAGHVEIDRVAGKVIGALG